MTSRSPRAVADRRRTSEADLRPAIYVRPLGGGYHVVRNVCNGQEYVVADGTAGATFTPGQVVSVASFTGNPGEFIIARPPAGFGGASAYAIAPVSAGYPAAATDIEQPPIDTESENFSPYCMDYSVGADGVALAGVIRSSADDYTADQAMGVYLAPLAGVPRAYNLFGSEVVRLAAPAGVPETITVLPGGNIAVWYRTDEAPVAVGSTQVYRQVVLSPSGSVVASSTFDGRNNYLLGADSCANGSLYSIESALPPYGPFSVPFPSYSRIVRRSPDTLAVEASYDWPSVTPFDGRGARSQWPLALVRTASGGGVIVWFQNTTDGFSAELWSRELDTSLNPVGSDVLFDPGVNSWPYLRFTRRWGNGSIYGLLTEPVNGYPKLFEVTRSGIVSTVLTIERLTQIHAFNSQAPFLMSGAARWSMTNCQQISATADAVDGEVLFSVVNGSGPEMLP